MLEGFFPGWRSNLLSLTQKAETHRDLIQFATKQMQYNNRSFSRHAFLELKVTLKPVVFKALFDKALPNQTVKKGLLEDIQSIENLQTGQSIDITDTYKLIRNRDQFIFFPKNASKSSLQNVQFTERELEAGVVFKYVKAFSDSPPKTIIRHKLVMDIAKMMFPLTIRNWEDGDVIQPFGMEGSQLVSSHLTNRKVPSHRKKEALVMESFDGMIAAVIFPPEKDHGQPGTISEQVRIGKTTQKIIKIEITQ